MSSDFTLAPFEPPPAPIAAAEGSKTHAWKDGESFGFHDVLDTINPLQHIPVVGAVYRWLTGDEPGNVARVAGDTLYGAGPIGFVVGLASVALKEWTGKDPGETALALLTGSGDKTPEGALVAVAAPAPQSPPQTATPPDGETSAAAPQPAAPQIAVAPTPILAHPPIPLVKATAPEASVPPTAADATGAAERAFLAQNAAFQHGAAGQRAAIMPARPITAPIPLQLSGPALALAPTRPTAAATNAVTAAIQQSPVSPNNPPAELSQRMLDALDRYMQLHGSPRGGQVDLVQ